MKKIIVFCLLFSPGMCHAQILRVPLACQSYLPVIEEYDWNVQTAIDVMYQESSCDPIRVNLVDRHKSRIYPRDYPRGYCIGSFGLFQTSCTRPIYYDAQGNINLAYQIYLEQGWGAWWTTCHTKIVCNY